MAAQNHEDAERYIIDYQQKFDLTNMEALMKELTGLESKGNLGKSVEDVQRAIDILADARNAIASGKSSVELRMMLY